MITIELSDVKTVSVKYVRIIIPVGHGKDNLPLLKTGGIWDVTIELETGIILDWPKGEARNIFEKVTDKGTYYLIDECLNTVFSISHNYVPHGIVPGDCGDYINLQINETGKVTNWPTSLDFGDFLDKENNE
jgi:hypothetical protein